MSDVPLSLMNCTEMPIRIKQGTYVGSVQKAEVITQLKHEHTENSNIKLPENLQPLLVKASSCLNPQETQQVKDLLLEFQDIFTVNSGKISQTTYANTHGKGAQTIHCL